MLRILVHILSSFKAYVSVYTYTYISFLVHTCWFIRMYNIFMMYLVSKR